MKSTFGRSFSVFAGILLIALTVLGGSFQLMVQDYLTETTFDALEQDAQIVADLAASYLEDESLSGREFLMNLDIACKVSGSDAVICNSQGKVRICSDSMFGCEHLGLYVNESYLKKILTQGSDRATGLIKGLYNEERFLVALPVAAPSGNSGIIIVSTPSADVRAVLTKISNIFLTTAICVILVSVVAVSFFARRESRPLQDLAKAANAFGHGNLEARVRVEEGSSEELEELALAFNNMASSLQKSEYRRQEFVANVSHELKTPMTTISGYVDGMLDKTIPEEKKIHFDLEECCGQVLITFEKKIEDKQLNVEVDMPEHPVYTFANEDYITQVIYNLLDNAVKFCPPGKTLGLKIREGGAKAYISVSNEGDTIPPEELPLVFDRFHKLDKSRSQNRDGWGLGLYIVKTIVCSHGENIGVTSRDGKTEFTFTMPLVN